MSGTIKRMTAVLLSVILMTTIFTVLPFTANAAKSSEAVSVQSHTSGDCSWVLDDNGLLTISGNGEMEESQAGWSKDKIKEVVIEDGVTKLSQFAFARCFSLKKVTIGNSLISIDWRAFYNCKFLETVTIGSSVTSIGEEAFMECKSLNSINIPNAVTKINEYAFCECESLETVIIPDNTTEIGKRAFANCDALKNLTIGNKVSKIGEEAFLNCIYVKEYHIPDSVTSIGARAFGFWLDMYDDYTKLKNITIYGKTGTAAEQYAKENGFTFIPISDDPTEPTTVEPTTAEPTTVEPTTEPAPAVMVGDVNGDGVVNGADAGVLSRYTSGWKDYEEKIKNPAAADVNADGKINGADAGFLSRYVSGWMQYARYFV